MVHTVFVKCITKKGGTSVSGSKEDEETHNIIVTSFVRETFSTSKVEIALQHYC